MRTKKINKDPFGSGTSHATFETYNCNKCIKASQPREDGTFTNAGDDNMPNRCAIQRDIIIRMFCDDPISERTIKICEDFTLRGITCPCMKTKRKKYTKKVKNQTELKL